MLFPSRNNAVEHIAIEHVFAFSMISENLNMKPIPKRQPFV